MLHSDQDEEDKKLFKDVFFVVEANRYEKESLRDDYSSQSMIRRYLAIDWQEVSESHIVEIGRLHDRPIGLNISFAFLNGRKVMFYNVCSELKDSRMVEEWFQKYLPLVIQNRNRWNEVRLPKTDAMNFHLAFT